MSKEAQSLILDYVRTAAIVLGIYFALLELYNASGQNRRVQFETSAQMIAAFGRPEIADGALALVEAEGTPVSGLDFNEVMLRLTPLRQHLITWTACMKFGTCDSDVTLPLLCSRLVSYEDAVAQLYRSFGRAYDRTSRDEQYFGYLTTCDPGHVQSGGVL